MARFPTKGNFAPYSGTAPVEASSGEMVRHRLSLAGNRHLNTALQMVAVCQARSEARGGDYYRKKIAEGKSRKGRRCGVLSGASPTPSSRALWQIWNGLRPAWLDKEEPRIRTCELLENPSCRQFSEKGTSV